MKTMKRILAASISLLMLTSVLTACGGASKGNGESKADGAQKPAEKTTVNLWVSGSDNVRLVYESLSKQFNALDKYNEGKYELKVQYVASGGGGQSMRDKIVAAYKAGQKNVGIDLVEMNDEDLSVIGGAGDDILVKYDAAKIPNLSSVTARPSQYKDFAVPYRGTTVVLAYNSETVQNPPKTVEELTQWIKDHPGRFSYNSAGTGGAGDSFIRSSVYNFLPDEAFMSNDAKWSEQWDKGFDYLKEIHPSLYKSSGKVVYPNKNQGVLDLLNNKEIDMCPAWADQALSGIKNGTLPASTKIYQISPSLTGAVCTFGIPSFSGNIDGAYAVVNFMLSPDAQNILLNEMQAIPLVDMNTLDQTSAASIKDLDASKFRTQSIGDLGKVLTKRWNEEIATIG